MALAIGLGVCAGTKLHDGYGTVVGVRASCHGLLDLNDLPINPRFFCKKNGFPPAIDGQNELLFAYLCIYIYIYVPILLDRHIIIIIYNMSVCQAIYRNTMIQDYDILHRLQVTRRFVCQTPLARCRPRSFQHQRHRLHGSRSSHRWLGSTYRTSARCPLWVQQRPGQILSTLAPPGVNWSTELVKLGLVKTSPMGPRPKSAVYTTESSLVRCRIFNQSWLKSQSSDTWANSNETTRCWCSCSLFLHMSIFPLFWVFCQNLLVSGNQLGCFSAQIQPQDL